MVDQRVAEAASLRQFFQEQWEHLQCLIEDQQRKSTFQRERRKRLDHAIEAIVAGTDARLRSLLTYQSQLRQSARGLLEYIEGIVSALPAPLVVSRKNLTLDPMVHYLFQDESLIQRLFREHPLVEAFLANPQEGARAELYALVYLSKQEKRTFGADLWDSMLVTDAPQTLVCFGGHEIIAVTASEGALRSAVKKVLFESIIAHIHLELLRVRIHAGQDHPRDARDPRKSLDNPMVYMAMLKQSLAAPRELLALHQEHLMLTKLGVKVTAPCAPAETSTDTLELQEVSVGDRQTQVLCMVCYPL